MKNNERSFLKLVIFTIGYSFLSSIILVVLAWFTGNVVTYGFAIDLYRNYIDLDLYLYVLLATFLLISGFLISIILPRSRFKKLSGILGWLLIIGCFSVGFYLIYLSKS